MRQLRKRQRTSASGSADEEQDPPSDGSSGSEPATTADGGGGGSTFRFSTPASRSASNADRTVAGLDERDEKLLRNATLYGGRLLTLVTLASLIFYIYVGVSGGITDGSDRFPEQVEPLAETIAREGASAIR